MIRNTSTNPDAVFYISIGKNAADGEGIALYPDLSGRGAGESFEMLPRQNLFRQRLSVKLKTGVSITGAQLSYLFGSNGQTDFARMR